MVRICVGRSEWGLTRAWCGGELMNRGTSDNDDHDDDDGGGGGWGCYGKGGMNRLGVKI